MTEQVEERGGFRISWDENGASSECLHCTAYRYICVRCRDPKRPAMFCLPSPWGSSLSNVDVRVCAPCQEHLVNQVRAMIGAPAWEPA